MEKLSLSMLILNIGVLLFCFIFIKDVAAEELDMRSKRKCENPNGKINQLKNLGCKSAVCSKEAGKMIWKECKQPATEEKQTVMIGIQTETKEMVNEINNKQTRVIERQEKMIEIQKETKDKTDQISNKQSRVLEGQDKMIGIQNKTYEKVDQINNKQTRVIERQDKTIKIQEETKEKMDQINNKQSRIIEGQDSMIVIQNETREKVDQINNKQTRILERQDKIIDIQTVTQEKVDQIDKKQKRVINLLERICGADCMPVIFQKDEEHTITRGTKLTQLSWLGRQYIITFQLLLTKTAEYTPMNIIAFTTDLKGGNWGTYGVATPSLSVRKGNKFARLRTAINGTSYEDVPVTTPDLAIDTWYNIEISQLSSDNEVYFSFKMDGVTYTKVKNYDAREFENVEVQASNWAYYAAPGKFRFFKVRSMA